MFSDQPCNLEGSLGTSSWLTHKGLSSCDGCITYPKNPRRVGENSPRSLRAPTSTTWKIHAREQEEEKKLPIYVYPHLTLFLIRYLIAELRGVGVGVNRSAGGAVEVLCSSLGYRHAAYRRMRRDGALGVGLRDEGYVGR